MNTLYSQANMLLAEASQEKAKNIYQKLLKSDHEALDPNMKADILHNLGMIAESEEDVSAAIRFYREAIAINENRSATWLFLARIYLNRFEKNGDSADYQAGVFSVVQAEKSATTNYPVIGLLKKKYALS